MPVPTPGPTLSTTYLTACPPTATSSIGDPTTIPSATSTRTPSPGPSPTRTPTAAWTPACCSIQPSAQYQYIEPGWTTCAQRDTTIDNQSSPFDVSAFCGTGEDRYAARIAIHLCCGALATPPATPDCSAAPGQCYGATVTGYDAQDQVVYSGYHCIVSPDPELWVVTTGCELAGDSLPVRWSVVMGSSEQRPWKLVVTYLCCYGGNCAATATPTPTP